MELLESKRLSGQAMEELLALARQPQGALLDDHRLIPALHSQVRLGMRDRVELVRCAIRRGLVEP